MTPFPVLSTGTSHPGAPGVEGRWSPRPVRRSRDVQASASTWSGARPSMLEDEAVRRRSPMSVKCILVGTDGSEHAQRAVRWAADLAAQTGAEVVAGHAVGLLVTTPDGPVPSTPFHDR